MCYHAFLNDAATRQATAASPATTLLKHLGLETRASATIEDLYSGPIVRRRNVVLAVQAGGRPEDEALTRAAA